MVNAQQWLDEKYPNELTRQQVKELVINPYTVDNQSENAFKLELEGPLIVNSFEALKKLYLYSNKLTKLTIVNCPKIELISCTGNLLTDLDFLSALDPKKLTGLYLENNNISEQDLSCFANFINLTTLLIGNSDESKIRKGIYNRFTGSLKFLKDLTNLERLSIKNTDVDNGLEYLPSTVKEFHCLADQRAESRVRKIEKELKDFLISGFRGTYNFDDWRKNKKGKLPSLSDQGQIYCPNKKRKISQKESECWCWESDLGTNNFEKEQQWFQQIETSYYKK